MIVLLSGCDSLITTGDNVDGSDAGDGVDGVDGVDGSDASDGQIDAGMERACARVRVDTDGRSANVRSLPSTEGAVVDALAYGAEAVRLESVEGEAFDGNSIWFHIETETFTGYVFSGIAECVEPGDVDKGFVLPFECGKTTFVSQGNFGSYSHTGIHEYAYDFRLAVGDPLYAMAPGTVTALFNEVKPGDPCYNGGGLECSDYANWVLFDHPDGSETILAHLSSVAVSVGQTVERGELIGYGGSTGYSGNPHVHIARRATCCQSIPLTFIDTEDGQPEYLENVTSDNCPTEQ